MVKSVDEKAMHHQVAKAQRWLLQEHFLTRDFHLEAFPRSQQSLVAGRVVVMLTGGTWLYSQDLAQLGAVL